MGKADGKHCPVCAKDIGVWSVVSSPLPTMIRCPRCRSRLRYSGMLRINIVLSIVLAILVAACAGLAWLVSSVYAEQLTIWCIALLIAWAPVELAAAWYLRNHCELNSPDEGRMEV